MSKRVSIIEASEGAVGASFHDYELLRFEQLYLDPGVFNPSGGGLAVSERSTGANMSVEVANGTALIQITNTNTVGETYKVYFDVFDGPEIINIPEADATNPRIDLIVARVDVSTDPDSSAGNVAILELVEGTPAGSPVAPETPANSTVLARVSVAAGATSIEDDDIVDYRTELQIKSTVLRTILRQGFINSFTTVGGTGNAITLTSNPQNTALVDGYTAVFRATAANSGATTINMDGLGAKDVKKNGGSDLEAGDLKIGDTFMVTYNEGEDEWRLIAPPRPASADNPYLGDASDGSYTLDGTQATVSGVIEKVDATNYKLLKDCQFDTIIVNSGITLHGNGYILRAKTKFEVNGTWSAKGGDGGDGTQGANGSATTAGGTAGVQPYTSGSLPVPKGGKDGGIGASSASSAGDADGIDGDDLDSFAFLGNGANGGPGQNAGYGKNGVAGIGGTGTITENEKALTFQNKFLLESLNRIFQNGGGPGSGGGGGPQFTYCSGGSGGASGANGGYLGAFANLFTGTGTIDVRGGDGGDGGNARFSNGYHSGPGAGGGGGHGGYATVASITDTFSGTALVTGGAKGIGGIRNGVQYAAGDGEPGQDGYFFRLQLS